MRRVSLARVGRRVPAAWQTAARALVQQLVTASALQKARLIKKNAPLWSELRDALWSAGREKCWYSEVLLSMGEAEVEHFRPKGRLSGEAFAGYWWLAFEWRNYRLASHLANTRRKDPINKGLRGKGGYFPLAGGTRATYLANAPALDPLCIACEKPLLLDPVEAADVQLLTFDQDGLPRPDPVRCTNQLERSRVESSIKFYALDDGVLIARRADVWKQVLVWSEELEPLVAQAVAVGLTDAQDIRRRQLETLISDAIDSAAEFSSTAIAALRTLGDRGWNTALISAVS